MDNTVSTRAVLVTGGSQRLGKAIVLRLAELGWNIGLHYRHSKEKALETAAKVTALGRQCVLLQGDLNEAEQRDLLFSTAVSQLGQLDAVVNNAALFEYDSAANFSAALLQAHLGPNLIAPIELAQQLAQHIATRPTTQGVVINMLDQKLWGYNPDFFSYTLCKAALQAATTMLAQGLAPAIRVVGVAPGLTLPSHMQTPADFQRTHAMAPLGKSSTPEDIAQTVAFAIENHSITGTTIVVDSGQHLMGLQRDFSLL